MFTSPGEVAFTLGPFAVRWYGIVIGIGIILCYLHAVYEARRRGVDHKPIETMALPVILAGIIGARLYYVLFNLSYFVENPLEILQIWHGGLAIHGALLGGAGAFFIYIFKHKLHWPLYADIIIPGILLAQGIGRWGNFFNNEAFGRPADLPWKVFIPLQNRPEAFADFSYFHPTFLYESLWNLAGFVVLIILARKLFPFKAVNGGKNSYSNKEGVILCAYLLWYSLGRFFIEGLRLDSLYLGPVRIAQLMSLMLFLTGLFGLLFLRRRSSMK